MTDRNPAAMGKSGKAGERVKVEDGKGNDRDKPAAGADAAPASAHKSPKKRRKVNHGTHSYRLSPPPAPRSPRDCPPRAALEGSRRVGVAVFCGVAGVWLRLKSGGNHIATH